MDRLRIQIWDFLYGARGPKSIDEITRVVNLDDETVRAAIDHGWFNVVDGMVTIAYGTA